MRSQDGHTLRSRGCKFVAGRSRNTPRYFYFVLNKTKNDSTGSGPVDGRTFLCPCVCMTKMGDQRAEEGSNV